MLYAVERSTHFMNPSLCKAGRAWQRSTSRKRRQLREPLAIYMNDLSTIRLIYGIFFKVYFI